MKKKRDALRKETHEVIEALIRKGFVGHTVFRDTEPRKGLDVFWTPKGEKLVATYANVFWKIGPLTDRQTIAFNWLLAMQAWSYLQQKHSSRPAGRRPRRRL